MWFATADVFILKTQVLLGTQVFWIMATVYIQELSIVLCFESPLLVLDVQQY